MTVKTDEVVIEGLKEWKQEILDLQNDKEEILEDLKNEAKIIVAKKRCLQAARGTVGDKEIAEMISDLETERKKTDTAISKLDAEINSQKQIDEVILREIDKSVGILNK
ncbi:MULTISPECIES: hypothetical protein [Bacillus cereus group]|uniref:Uncharacterized protein n=1 Tax=Bacillus thuringiensis TaxID=1428 RepID=A0A1C4FG81_BACTU|nr:MULTISPECIES: hypothetical protein [Bacillus cereus group]MED3026166.1 hypothetical protein [Bacillus wiedmannii]SCC54852.1 Protein of unknown function [Bacillus thuringiensis]